MSRCSASLAAIIIAIAALMAAPSFGANQAPPGESCVFSHAWWGWRSPAPNVILLRVNVDDVYRLDLKKGSKLLSYPDVYLINRQQSSDWLCSPDDFDLLLKEGNGMFSEPLFVKKITKLTPAEIAAIPPKDRP